MRRVDWEHATLLFRAGGVVYVARKKESGMIKSGLIVGIAALLVLCGCETRRIPPSSRRMRYGDESEIVTGSKNITTMYDLESATRLLMAKLRSSSSFASKCKSVKNTRSRLPLVVVGGIENKTGMRIQDRLDSLVITVRSSLFETDFLEVKDDEAADKIRKRIHLSADGGLETGDLVQFLGEHNSPDFIILGDLRQFEDAGIIIYKLHFAVHSFVTGMIAWEGVQTIEKL